MVLQRILLVCLGNICRSPMAEGILAHLVKERGLIQSIELDSAGTGAYHIGSDPDPRAQSTCLAKGITLHHKARQVKPQDFETFDYILAMDLNNYEALKKIAPHDHLHLMRSFDPLAKNDLNVPDPYYGGVEGFEEVYDMLYRSANGLLDHVLEKIKSNMGYCEE
ncbi:MAG: protein tyrosine phosphatase [Chitinophagaceae bacterium]|nr:protein tyrosine phosphatase [Chitinophagaceae bacterium]